jgi:hypothetical protein
MLSCCDLPFENSWRWRGKQRHWWDVSRSRGGQGNPEPIGGALPVGSRCALEWIMPRKTVPLIREKGHGGRVEGWWEKLGHGRRSGGRRWCCAQVS